MRHNATNFLHRAGDQQQSFVVVFEEPSGANPLVQMMMQGMAASADARVQKELAE
jgi:hypothetical protein